MPSYGTVSKSTKSFSHENIRTNAFAQGDSYSLQVALATIAIWTYYIQNKSQQISTGSFLDDSHFYCSDPSVDVVASRVAKAWIASQKYDEISGLETNIDKTFIFANSQQLEVAINNQIVNHYGPAALKCRQSFRLVGSVITTRGVPETKTRSSRIANTLHKLQRIRAAPVRFSHKIKLAEAVFAGAVFGSEMQECSVVEHNSLRSSVVALLWGGSTWCRSFAITFMHIVPGFRLLLHPASIYHCLNVARRLRIRHPDLHDLFTQSWNAAVAKNGPVARIASAVESLDAEWIEPFVIKTSEGIELNLLSPDRGEFQHNLREAMRHMITHKDAPIHTRKDMVGGPLFLYESNTKLLRASEKVSVIDHSLTLNLFEPATLRNIMSGTTRTAERLHAANQLNSPICVWCQLNNVEDHDRFFWSCPAWESKRLAFFSKWGDKVFSLPPCTRHCGLLPANVLNSHFLGSAKEATLFAVDLQRRMIAVTHACDLAKKELATQTPEVYQADNCADDKQSDKSSTGEVSKMQTVDPKDMFPAYPWSYGIDFEGQTLFQGEIPEQWRRYSKGSEWLFDVVWINYF
jgi:hypothetical protein